MLLDPLYPLWCRSVAKSCLTLCDPMDCSAPCFPVLQCPQSLLKLVSIEAMMPSNHLVTPFSSCPQSFPTSGSFQMSQLFASGGQSTGVSASTSVLPMNIQDWFLLGWTGWISLNSKGLSRVFSNTTVQKHQFFSAQLSSQSNTQHPYMTTRKTIALTRQTFVDKVMSLLFNMCHLHIWDYWYFSRPSWWQT